MKNFKENTEIIEIYSVNGVPYPLDEYLKLSGQPTTEQIAKAALKWPKYKTKHMRLNNEKKL